MSFCKCLQNSESRYSDFRRRPVDAGARCFNDSETLIQFPGVLNDQSSGECSGIFREDIIFNVLWMLLYAVK
jgi:hypothetical protein